MEQLTKNQAVATSQEAVQNQNEPQLRDENAHNDKSVHGVLNPTYQAGLRRDAVQPDIEAERKKRDEIEAGKSYCSRRFGEIGRAVQQECRDRSRMPSSARKKKLRLLRRPAAVQRHFPTRAAATELRRQLLRPAPGRDPQQVIQARHALERRLPAPPRLAPPW